MTFDRSIKIAPSILAADFANFGAECAAAEAEGADFVFEASDVTINDVTTDQPWIGLTVDGEPARIDCDIVDPVIELACDQSRIVLDDRAGGEPVAEVGATEEEDVRDQLLSALLNLGYPRAQAERVVDGLALMRLHQDQAIPYGRRELPGDQGDLSDPHGFLLPPRSEPAGRAHAILPLAARGVAMKPFFSFFYFFSSNCWRPASAPFSMKNSSRPYD